MGGRELIVVSGEMGELIRSLDWGSTPMGALADWSKELLAAVNMMLASPMPALMYWGPSLILLYNDAARPIASVKHPWALGAPAVEVWREAWPIFGPAVEQVMQQGVGTHRENVLVPLEMDGKLQDLYWDYTYSPLYEGGRVAGALLICQNITEAYLAARTLREVERRSDRVLQSIGDAVIVTDAEARVTRMNPVAERLTGWKEREAKLRPLSEVFHIVNETTRVDNESPVDKVKRLNAVVGLANHTVLIARDGRETHIDDSGAPIRGDDGELTGIVLVFRDVEAQRRAEREKQLLATQMEQILAATTEGVALLDRGWRFVYLNRRGREVLQVTEEVVGRNAWEAFPGMVFEGSPYVYHYHRAMEEGIAGISRRSTRSRSLFLCRFLCGRCRTGSW